MSPEEELLAAQEDALKRQERRLEIELAETREALRSPRFGWTRDPPPKSGIIEVADGFSATHQGFLGEDQHTTILPGFVDAAFHALPDGILWRPKP